MRIADVIEALSLRVICPPAECEREITGVYVGDLLSRAMSRVQSGDLWITIMANKNVIAVAELTDAAIVLLAEDVELSADAKAAAEENGITVCSSPKSAYELCLDADSILKEAV